jgi:hypothetical protein
MTATVAVGKKVAGSTLRFQRFGQVIPPLTSYPDHSLGICRLGQVRNAVNVAVHGRSSAPDPPNPLQAFQQPHDYKHYLLLNGDPLKRGSNENSRGSPTSSRAKSNVVALRPKNVCDVAMGTHFEITAPVSGKVIARALPQI